MTLKLSHLRNRVSCVPWRGLDIFPYPVDLLTLCWIHDTEDFTSRTRYHLPPPGCAAVDLLSPEFPLQEARIAMPEILHRRCKLPRYLGGMLQFSLLPQNANRWYTVCMAGTLTL
jgi:hypothetical protein